MKKLVAILFVGMLSLNAFAASDVATAVKPVVKKTENVSVAVAKKTGRVSVALVKSGVRGVVHVGGDVVRAGKAVVTDVKK